METYECAERRERRRAARLRRERALQDPARHRELYRRGAERRGKAFELDVHVARVLFDSPCFYCGAPPGGAGETQGIDRFDNARGYSEDNVVACCWCCNRAKGTLHGAEFVALCRRVAARHADNRGMPTDPPPPTAAGTRC